MYINTKTHVRILIVQSEHTLKLITSCGGLSPESGRWCHVTLPHVTSASHVSPALNSQSNETPTSDHAHASPLTIWNDQNNPDTFVYDAMTLYVIDWHYRIALP